LGFYIKVLIICILLVISCKGNIEKTNSDYFSNLQFSVDTVIIDPDEEIIFEVLAT